MKKVITYPIVFLCKIIFELLEFVLFLPLELIGLNNQRMLRKVELRSVNPNKTKLKTYRPKGFFGLPSKFFLNKKLESSNWVFYSEEAVKHAFESNVPITKDMKVFQVPEISLLTGYLKKDIEIKDFNQDQFISTFPAKNLLKNGEFEGNNTTLMLNAKIDDLQNEIFTIREAIKNIGIETKTQSGVVDVSLPVNDMNEISVTELLKIMGAKDYSTLNFAKKIELVRTTKLRFSRNINKILDKDYMKNLTIDELKELAEKLRMNIQDNTTKSKLQKDLYNKARFIKDIRFN